MITETLPGRAASCLPLFVPHCPWSTRWGRCTETLWLFSRTVAAPVLCVCLCVRWQLEAGWIGGPTTPGRCCPIYRLQQNDSGDFCKRKGKNSEIAISHVSKGHVMSYWGWWWQQLPIKSVGLKTLELWDVARPHCQKTPSSCIFKRSYHFTDVPSSVCFIWADL